MIRTTVQDAASIQGIWHGQISVLGVLITVTSFMESPVIVSSAWRPQKRCQQREHLEGKMLAQIKWRDWLYLAYIKAHTAFRLRQAYLFFSRVLSMFIYAKFISFLLTEAERKVSLQALGAHDRTDEGLVL